MESKSENPRMEQMKSLINHLENTSTNLTIIDNLESKAVETVRSHGAIYVNTPIVTHGMQEYNQSLAKVTFDNGNSAYLRHSPQFDKQCIVLSTDQAYCQKSGSCRPGDIGKFHSPYLNLLDMEFPFRTERSSPEEAKLQIANTISRTVCESLAIVGKTVERVDFVQHSEVLAKFGTDAPYVAPYNSDANLLIVQNPPLFYLESDGSLNTCMNPVMQPIWTAGDMEQAFINNELNRDELMSLRVQGFDVVVSAPGLFSENEECRGLEIGGGGVRINQPEVLARVVEHVRQDTAETFDPLKALLTHYKGSGKFTAGGAIGMDRLAMVAVNAKHITQTQALPWSSDGAPLFSGNKKLNYNG